MLPRLGGNYGTRGQKGIHRGGRGAAVRTARRPSRDWRRGPVDNAQLEATEAAIAHVTASSSTLVKHFGEVVALRSAPAAKAAKSLEALGDTGQ